MLKKILWQNSFWIVNKKLAKEVWIEWALLLSDLIDKEEYFKEKWEMLLIEWKEYFYNTIDNIEKDTTLSVKLQRKNIKILKEKWLINVKLKWIPAKRYFYINEENIINLLLQKYKTRCAQKDKLEEPKSTTNNNKEKKNKK